MGDLCAPLRVAVIGAGPAGFFATAEILRRKELTPHVDMFERLPTPFGLVRNGVAPDHQTIKAVTKRYTKDADSGGLRFRLFGNVEVGKDVSVGELRERYHAVICAFGAQSNRRLEIPGEELGGVHPASVFVGWYNGHPDCVESRYDLSSEHVAVVGVGNVGLDVARTLMKPIEDLRKTDISDLALRALSRSRIREVFLIGRQSLATATFTPAELEELTEIPGCDLVAAPEDRLLEADEEAALERGELEPHVRRNIEIVRAKALPEALPGRKAVRLLFYRTPVAILGEERATALRVRRSPAGSSGEAGHVLEDLPCGLVFRAIGYKVVPIPGVPFDEGSGTVPHQRGQVADEGTGEPAQGLFVTGWAKRGPQGVIGTNKPDATETVASLLAAWEKGALSQPAREEADSDIVDFLDDRRVIYVTYSDWKLLDQIEVESGAAEGRPRKKFTDSAAMLYAIASAKMTSLPHEELVSSPD
jgi:ferredoxin--NADP+ reductase